MKLRTIYTLFGFIAFGATLMSNSLGMAAQTGKGNTAAPGDEADAQGRFITCGTCHTNGSFAPTMTIKFIDSLGNDVVKYIPGKLYRVRASIRATTGTPFAYGFQMIDIKESNNANVKGFPSGNVLTSQPANVKISTIPNGRIYAENNQGGSNSNIFDVKWRAPAAGAGTVVFYASGIATNGGQGMRGDGAANAVAKFYQDTTARLGGSWGGSGNNNGLNGGVTNSTELTSVQSLQLFPNPASDFVHIQWTSNAAATYQMAVRNATGATILTDTWTAQNGDNQQVIDIQNWAAGVYTLQLTDGKGRVIRKIVKQ
jgi:Secretion system C-terminal sorting domain